MKKIGVFLGVLFMGLLIFVRSPAPARADAWVLPFSKVPDIIEMAQTLFSGGKLEFSSIISNFSGLDDIVDMWQDFKDRLAHSQTAKRSNDTISALVDLTRNGISVLESSTDLVIPFTFADDAAFIQYNPYWYLHNITFPDNPVATPDPNYISYINRINLRDSSTYNSFWFYDLPLSYYYNNDNTNLMVVNNVPITNYSYCVADINSSFDINAPTPYLRVSNIIDVNIYSYNNTYSTNFTVNCHPYAFSQYRNNNLLYNDKGIVFNSVNGNYYAGVSNNSWSDTLNFSYNGSLSQVLNYIAEKVKNVNIYVDGVLWAYVGVQIGLPVLAPDVISIGDTGQDTYDVYGLEMPGDLGLDIPNFIDWILNKLMEGATTISLDDAIAEEVPLVKTIDGVRAINYEDTRPIERVIEITLDDPDPNPTPTPNPDDPTPPILKLPTFNMMPAPHETTVLSELIDATQQTVPEELINLIWNCFGLLVIGGLIFILHK